MSFKILTLNHIAVEGLRHLPRELYEVASEIGHPDGILVRSANMHDMEIPESVMAIARAGAGVNNIPVAALTKRGIPVFNAPGANANAVKELVIAGLLLGARNICQAWRYVLDLEGSDAEIGKLVEAGKKRYVGFELPGKTLGVIGLGAIGVEVANAAHDLGMRVIGYDPQLTVKRAWQLSSGVEQAASLDDLFARSDIVTPHVPLVDGTRNLVNADGAETDDAERLAGQLETDVAFLSRLHQLADLCVAAFQIQDVSPGLADIPGAQQQAGNHQFLDRVGVGPRRIEYRDTPLGASVHGDIVDAGAGPGDGHHALRDLHVVHIGGTHQDTVRVADLGRHFIKLPRQMAQSLYRDIVQRQDLETHQISFPREVVAAPPRSGQRTGRLCRIAAAGHKAISRNAPRSPS